MAFQIKQYGEIQLLCCQALLDHGVPHGFTTRPGGVSQGTLSSLNLGVGRGDLPERVLENYRRVTAAAGLDSQGVVFSRQIHSDRVRIAVRRHRGMGLLRLAEDEADATITNQPGVVPVIFTADCTPLLLFDPRQNAVGAVHAGWRGTAAGIAARAVEAMTRTYGTRPEDVIAAIGPAICQNCFECGPEVPAAMVEQLGADALPLVPRRGDRWFPDLKGLNRLCLLQAGVSAHRIFVSDACTREDETLFWSHRRDGAGRGSQAAMIGIVPAARVKGNSDGEQ